MFDIGFSELVVIGLLALIVLGPKRLPEVARTAGRWMGQLRRFIADVKQDLDREMHSEDLAELRKLKHELNDTRRLMENTSGDLIGGFEEVIPASSPTIQSSKSSKLAGASSSETVPPPTPAKRPRARTSDKSRSGKKHGGTRKARRH